MSKSGSARPKVGAGSRIWLTDRRPPKHEQWVWQTRDMLESPAWRALSLPARRVLDRLILEYMAHAGTENGNLIVTSRNFRDWGISGKHLAAAIDELEALGFVTIKRGMGGNAEFRRPNLYGLTWLPTPVGRPTNNWRGKTEETVKFLKNKLKAKRAKQNPGPPGWSEIKPPEWCDGGTQTKH